VGKEGLKKKESVRCQFLAPMPLSWSRRATARVEASYAPDRPRGRQIIQEWSAISNE
jgi:hypothetical protein